jgi:hypothetical protein
MSDSEAIKIRMKIMIKRERRVVGRLRIGCSLNALMAV